MIGKALIGLLAGWLVNRYYRGTNPGLLPNLILGVIGSFLGGFVADLLGFYYGKSLIPNLIVAAGGSLLALWLKNKFIDSKNKEDV